MLFRSHILKLYMTLAVSECLGEREEGGGEGLRSVCVCVCVYMVVQVSKFPEGSRHSKVLVTERMKVTLKAVD